MTLQEELQQMKDATMERMPQSVVQVLENSIISIEKQQLKQRSLQKGNYIEDLLLTTVEGKESLLSSFIKGDYLILNFYRGGWCPYCNMELRAYEELHSEFNKLNIDIIGISSELPLFAKETTNKNAINFPLVVDINAQLMKKIGIVFQLDEATKREYENFGLDLSKFHGNTNDELPVPAVYVIDKTMKIVFTHFEEDYMTRLEPSTLLENLKSL
ncbi:peroxiredoxin-like family protein [Tenacibaculum sp. M341]|uniref:peroxiredoxin-like family protein n=1 Tax=Tenacibaculum sp. M341 TaxID=2530339 RepID=UPI00104988CE|nr:peroxiredoxin-like family protein [Tenacibaculum sp. M341]TCI84913.1 AhpC/TSA family protein [Tenacibaculum sp. M341]